MEYCTEHKRFVPWNIVQNIKGLYHGILYRTLRLVPWNIVQNIKGLYHGILYRTLRLVPWNIVQNIKVSTMEYCTEY
jgi:membrane protein YdbS with pleckstrin-like domain